METACYKILIVPIVFNFRHRFSIGLRHSGKSVYSVVITICNYALMEHPAIRWHTDTHTHARAKTVLIPLMDFHKVHPPSVAFFVRNLGLQSVHVS